MRGPASFAQENDYLRAQVRQLQDALGIGLHWPPEWRLSPRETAVLAAGELGIEVIEHEPLAAGFDGRAALELVRAGGPDERVPVVGHNPDFEQVIHDLTGARAPLKKGGVAGIRLEGGMGELLVLLRPREIDRLASGSSS